MKKIYFLFLMLSSALTFGQTEIFNLAGGGAFPGGWSAVNNVTTNDIDRGSYYLVDSGAPSDVITSDVYDLSSYSSATFTLDVASFGGGTHNQALIEISFDGGGSFTQTELSTVTTGSSYIAGGSFNLNSVTNGVQIRISNNGASGRGVRLRNLKLEAIGTTPDLTFTAPTDGTTFAAGTTSVDVNINVVNFTVANGTGDGYIQWTLNTNGAGAVAQPDKFDTNTESITVSNGNSYVVEMTLVDNGGTPIIPTVTKSISFSVSHPCDLQLTTITTTCDAETAGVDTYTTTIDFTGGGTSTYTINTGGVGSVVGDDPSSMASGTISIIGVNEGTDFTVNVTGDASNSSCDIDRNISSPTCVSATCAAAGSIIITEVMQNPNIPGNGDPNGEWFEVYNTTGAPIDMSGWIIKDETTASETHTISSLIVPAMGYAVIGNAAMPNGGITFDYTYGNDISLGNGTDGLIIECSSTTIDAVTWDNGSTFPDPNGSSMELAQSTFNSTDNDTGTNWGVATSGFGDAGQNGTPGGANDFVLSIANNTIEGFKIFPNPTKGSFITIITANNQPLNVEIFDLLGKKVIENNNVTNQVNIADLQTGIYVVKVTENNKSATKRLIVR